MGSVRRWAISAGRWARTGLFELTCKAELLIGRRLRARRKFLGLTQRQLADMAAISPQQLAKYEYAGSSMSVTMLWNLSCLLKVDIDYFVSGLPRQDAPRAAPSAEPGQRPAAVAAA